MDKKDLILLWNDKKDKIISYIAKKIRDTDIADDILQDIFIKFWDNYDGIKDKNKVYLWLLSVARFTVADYYREKQNKSIKLDSIILNSCPCDNNESIDESHKLLPLIYSLPLKYKNILILSDIYGIPHKIISEQFNLTVSCVKTRVIRGRKLLSNKMHECCTFKHDKYGNIISCLDKKEYKVIVERFKKNNQNMPLFYSFPDNK
jgi:RNA polymerase sigma-70 factor (ECF subfamily)